MMFKSRKLSEEQGKKTLAAARGDYSGLTLEGWGKVIFTIDLGCWELPFPVALISLNWEEWEEEEFPPKTTQWILLSAHVFANATMCSLHAPFSCRISTSTPPPAPSNSAVSWGTRRPRTGSADLCNQFGFSGLPSLAVPSPYSDASQQRDFFSRAISEAYKMCPDQGARSIEGGKKCIIHFCKSAKHAHKGHLWTSLKSHIREKSKAKVKKPLCSLKVINPTLQR